MTESPALPSFLHKSGDRLELAFPIKSCLRKDLVCLPASEVVAFLERVKRHQAPVVRANPPVHCGKREPCDTLCLLSTCFWKYPFLLFRRQEIKEFGTGDVIDIEVDAFFLNEG